MATIERSVSEEARQATFSAAICDANNRLLAIYRHFNEIVTLRRLKAPARWRLRVGLASVKGRRQVNEDSVCANVRDGLFVVADGIGGCLGGEIASNVLIDTMASLLSAPMLDDTLTHDGAQNQIRFAASAAHDKMREMARIEPCLKKMGSTMALGLVVKKTLHIAHVGDSRVYLVRQNTITRLTKDQTMVQALIDAGALTHEGALRSRFRHVILDSVNAEHPPGIEIRPLELKPGDRLLFTTDGLTDFVGDEDLKWIVTYIGDPQLAANVLVREALARNSKDNVTCLVVHVGRRHSPRRAIALSRS